MDKVVYQLNDGPFQVASLTTQPAKTVTWSADILASVQRGPNVLKVKSVDNAGNESKIEKFLMLMGKFGISELSRTGRVALARKPN